MALAKGGTAMFNNTRSGIINRRESIWAANIGNRKIEDSKSKKKALKRILEAIGIQVSFSRKSSGRGQL